MYFSLGDYTIDTITNETGGEIIDYGIKMVGAPLEWKECQGEGIKIGIIDTGIDLTHPDLCDRVVRYINFAGDDPQNIEDDNGHGTHVAGIVAASRNHYGVVGVAPKSQLYIAKAFDAAGNAGSSAIYRSIEWMLEEGVDLINMSFSSPSSDDSYHELVRKAYEQGVICICAAGNNGRLPGDTVGYPAKFDETISVVAVDIHKQRAPFSSKGNRVDIAAAGTKIFSCYPKNSFALLSGTSMATPIITGAAALLQNKAQLRLNRYLTPEEMKLILCIYSEDLGATGKDEEYGCGLFSFARLENLRSNSVDSLLAKVFS